MNLVEEQLSSPEVAVVAETEAVPRWKRVLDVSLIVLALPVILPVAFCISLLIWLVSDGPILFRQARVGLKGRRFLCYKFRTMHAGTETASHQGHLTDLIGSKKPMTKMDDVDPRIIPFGRP